MNCPIPSNKNWKRLLKHYENNEGKALVAWNYYDGKIPETFYAPKEAPKVAPVQQKFVPQEELNKKVKDKLATLQTEEELLALYNTFKPEQKELYKTFFTERKFELKKPKPVQKLTKEQVLDKLAKKLQEAKSIEKLTEMYNKLSDEQKTLYKSYFTSRKNELLPKTEVQLKSEKLDRFIVRNNGQYVQLKFKETDPSAFFAKVTGKRIGLKFEVQTQSGKAFYVKLENLVDDRVKPIDYQLQSNDGKNASEKTIRELTARIADRIGSTSSTSRHFEFRYNIISDRTQMFKGKFQKGVATINLAYATLDTPIHEILGHPIIRAIKLKSEKTIESEIDKMIEMGIIKKEC